MLIREKAFFMVEVFLRKTQMLEKYTENFQVILQIYADFVEILSYLVSQIGVKNSSMNNPRISRRQFGEIMAFFVEIGLKNSQKSMEQQKSTLFDKRITIFVQTTNSFEE